MAAVDVIVFSIILISCLFGIFRGLIKEALSLFFWVAAAVLASLYSGLLGESLDFVSNNTTVRRMAGFALIFIGTVFGGALINNLVAKLTAAAGLRGVDRSLGALFGIIRGVVIVTLVVMLTAQLEFTAAWYGESISVPYIMVMADYFRQLLGMTPDMPVV
jgi:membrane protein required for colicin V production